MKIQSKLIVWSLGAILLATAAQVHASSLLIDRGLPDANLNNVSGPNRSNVSWAYGVYPEGSWLVGDTLTNTSSSTYFIDTIRLWTVGATDSASLWGGPAGSDSYGLLSSSYTLLSVQYDGGLDYQGSSGSSIAINQIDFAVDLTLAAGQTLNFFLDGSRSSNPFIPYLHASNAALSGSPQDGADNQMLYALLAAGAINGTDIGSWTSAGNGWDKASDVNVQAYGRVPDSGSTLVLIGAGLGLLSALRLRKR